MLVMLTSMVRIHIIFDSRGGYDVDGSNDDDGNGHHDKDVDGVDDIGYVGGYEGGGSAPPHMMLSILSRSRAKHQPHHCHCLTC